MTEAEWLTCVEPEPMLENVRGRVSERKLRLLSGQFCLAYFAAHSWPEPADSTRVLAEEASEHGRLPEWSIEPRSDDLPCILLHEDAFTAVMGVAKALTRWVMKDHYHRCLFRGDFDDTVDKEKVRSNIDACFEEVRISAASLNLAQSNLLRDIFGNPFRPATFDPAWRTSTAVALASQMYESRDFAAMPILADALQDAGCDNDDVLNHCRGPGPHVRGCWVVDLVLGKE